MEINDKPTVCAPSDIYNCYEKNPEICAIMGIHTLEDADNFVKGMYKKEFWPERLKEDIQEESE